MRDENTSPHLEQLLDRLQDRSAVIGIVGLGYSVFR